jgi:hypothetical protein
VCFDHCFFSNLHETSGKFKVKIEIPVGAADRVPGLVGGGPGAALHLPGLQAEENAEGGGRRSRGRGRGQESTCTFYFVR